ncbi:MAG TPA: hypothetical protein VN782_15940 [Usitatibacter sp.]|nr:hypothetical protein [Usitatibacter sp.]
MSYDETWNSKLLNASRAKIKPCLQGTNFADNKFWDDYECVPASTAHEVIRPLEDAPNLDGVRLRAQADLLGASRNVVLLFDHGVLTSVTVYLGRFTRELYSDVMTSLSKRYTMAGFTDAEIKDFDEGNKDCVTTADDSRKVWLILRRGLQGDILTTLIYAPIEKLDNDARKCVPPSMYPSGQAGNL